VSIHYDRALHPFETNREVLRIGIQTSAQGRDESQPMNLVVVQDTSGSMERPDRVEILNSIVSTISNELSAKDKISLIGFARVPKLWIDGAPGGNNEMLVNTINNIRPEGGTNIEMALDLGFQKALDNYIPNGTNRLLLLTDGAANMGDVNPANLKKQVDSGRLAGVSMDCFGVGWDGYDDNLLEEMTRNSNGTYAFLGDAISASDYFKDKWLGSIQVSARDVKVQMEFNPERVSRYRQMGYLKHRLTKEQFYDDSVDAAEIPKAEDGQALYVIETKPDGTGPLGWVRVRFKKPDSEEVHMKVRPIAWNGASNRLEQSSNAMKLAFSSGAFAEKIAGNPFGANSDLSKLQNYVSEVVNFYPTDARPGQLLQMIRMARSLGL